MKTAFVSPSFWTGTKDELYKPDDQFYDHPLPLEDEGTLVRCIESMKLLDEQDFIFIIVSAATRPEVEDLVDEKIRELVKGVDVPFALRLFGYRELRKLSTHLREACRDDLLEPLDMYGYSGIRNMCLLGAHIAGAEIAISIDDDIVFNDPAYLRKAKEFIGTKVGEDTVLAVYSPYDYGRAAPDWDTIKVPLWKTHWNNVAAQRKAWERFILTDKRLNETSYIVMSNIVLHRDFFTKVPLDPHVNRGEDMDWLVNARMFGYKFFVDNRRRVKHLPPPRLHPTWRQLREDIIRFLYEREKVRLLEERQGIPRSYFEPFPGDFLNDDLEEKVFKSNTMLAMEYLLENDLEGVKGCLGNIQTAKEYPATINDPHEHMQRFQKTWETLMNYVDENRQTLCESIWQ